MGNWYLHRDSPKWNTVEDVHRILEEWRAAKRAYGTDQGVTQWAFQRWPEWAWKWQRPRRPW